MGRWVLGSDSLRALGLCVTDTPHFNCHYYSSHAINSLLYKIHTACTVYSVLRYTYTNGTHGMHPPAIIFVIYASEQLSVRPARFKHHQTAHQDASWYYHRLAGRKLHGIASRDKSGLSVVRIIPSPSVVDDCVSSKMGTLPDDQPNSRMAAFREIGVCW